MRRTLALAVTMLCVIAASAHAASGIAPGAPGAPAHWTPANKDGFGTATGTASKVWYTLSDGELTEVYYPDLGTPAVRDLQLVVSDGRTFAEREIDATTHQVTLADSGSLAYRQVDTAKSGRYRITKSYVTDPARNALLVRIHLESLKGGPLQVYVLHDPSLSNNGDDDSGTTSGSDLLVSDAHGVRRWWPRPPSLRRPTATSERATAGRTCAPTSGWIGSTRTRRTATSSRRAARR